MKNYLVGLKAGIPIFLGYVPVAITFGLMATENGLSAFIAAIISGTNLTSAGQFAGTALIITSAGLTEIALTTFVINLRYSLMSLSLSQRLDPSISLGMRLLLSFGITDEIFGIASGQKGRLSASFMLGLITLPYIGWLSGTIIGAVAADWLPASISSALGIAIFAMFIAIIVPPSKEQRPILFTVIIAAALSCLLHFTPFLNKLSSGWAIIVCALVSSVIAAILWPMKEGDFND